MIRVKPKYHYAFIPVLIFLISILVISLLVLAAFARDTAFWVVASLVDLVIIYVGYLSIKKYKTPRIMSAPLGKVFEFSGEADVEELEESEIELLKKQSKMVDTNE